MAVVSKGFTLLELLVVISIIGIIMAIGSVSFSTAQKKGRDSRRQGDMKAIQKSLEEYYALTNGYPASVTSGGSITYLTNTLMNQVPDDPKTPGTYLYTVDAGVAKTLYCLCAIVENASAANASGNASGVCIWTGTKDRFCVSNQQ
ncbi:prepilin-type N-terminal cleavage/methylation domain-containing protein [Patescibacteria group bacterium]|nr:prepilin-type N-terminal cleavage/methylation domain-containing protein [Patescibacteria group bacterium]MBU1499879.1 prepilin-type N-terminal cleavage/methylation domain-containing protein [Patescibacteria group bacterium]